MAFTRPTISELVDRIQQDFLARLALVSPILRRSLVYVFSRVIAGAVHMLHGHLEYLSRQAFPDLSEREFLVRQAALFGLALKPAEFASGAVVITGTDGVIIAAGTVLLRADGAAYATDAEATIAAGSATVAVTAKTAGANGNCAAGVTLSFESPIAGVYASTASEAGGIVNGADEERLESFRARFLERLRNPPHGGAAFDYVAWANEVAGVTRAWCYPTELGAGTVVVRFVRDDDTSIIPDAGEVAAVQAHIAALAPVTAAVTVLAPIADPLNYTISVTPNTSVVRAAVEAELKDLVRREAVPGGLVQLSHIQVAIGTAAGLTDFDLTSPAADVAHATGHVATHGVITWT